MGTQDQIRNQNQERKEMMLDLVMKGKQVEEILGVLESEGLLGLRERQQVQQELEEDIAKFAITRSAMNRGFRPPSGLIRLSGFLILTLSIGLLYAFWPLGDSVEVSSMPGRTVISIAGLCVAAVWGAILLISPSKIEED